MAHNHNHTHDHSAKRSKNIAVAFFLNLGFAVFEIVGGIYTNSVAITSDALHDFGDSISLGVSWYFEKIARRAPSSHFSYGLKRFSIIGAVVNSLVLLTGSVIILFQTIPRLIDPTHSDAGGMFWFAIIGIVVNGLAMLRLRSGSSLNERAVSLHMLEDVLGWVAVLAGSIVMYFFDLPIIDPILSLAITIYILYNVFVNLRVAMRIVLQGVPSDIDLKRVEMALVGIDGVVSIHDLHVWSMDSDYNVLSVHLVIDGASEASHVKQITREMLTADFSIQHATIEVETCDEACSMIFCN